MQRLRSAIRRAMVPAILLTLVAGGALAVAPSHAGTVGRLWIVALALIGSLTAAGLVATAPSDFQRGPWPWVRRRAPISELPGDLESLQLAVELATTSEFDRHYRLRPWMVAISSGLLARRWGIDLEHDQDRAKSLLGPELWELVRPDRPEPPGRGRLELEHADLERMASALEGLHQE